MRSKARLCLSVQAFYSKIRLAALLSGLLAGFVAAPCRAGYTDFTSTGNPVVDYFVNWFPRATRIQSEQPHWITPLVTVTPRLEQELRYDQSWTTMNAARYPQLDNYGTSKGVELIPFNPVEVIIGIPAYEAEQDHPSKYGWADETFLIKGRILSGNEENGNYILTAFFGLSVPSGSDVYSSHHFGFTPTIAGGKGWGDFSIQSTLGFSIPDNGFVHTGAGNSLVWNTAFQYRVKKYFWPEVEANYTWWPTGEHQGLNQLLITPGLVIGRIPIYGRVGMTFGLGCQFPVTDQGTIHRNVILSGRIPF
ncbi:MAG TPA: hypothetical protein VMF08_01690 [Candidatus Sulfotelmatobacter sp.]|nr:hypothetical protein [Candidatus Sulfotelmatobacter sp.]